MALPFTDDFNRADGGLGSNYTTLVAGLGIVSNHVSSSTGNGASYYNVDTPNADCYIKLRFLTLPSGGAEFIYTLLRYNTGTANGYMFRYLQGTGSQILIVNGGTPTQLALLGGNPAATDVVEFRISGNTLSVFYNGVSAGSTTDSTYSTAGVAVLGMSGSGQGGTVDDLEIGNYSAGTVVYQGRDVRSQTVMAMGLR